LLSLFAVLGVVPLLLGVVYYRSSARSVERLLREDLSYRAADTAHDLNANLSAQESDLRRLAAADQLTRYVTARGGAADPRLQGVLPSPAADDKVPSEVEKTLREFMIEHAGLYSSLTLVDGDRQPLVLAEMSANSGDITFKTGALLPAQLASDERVWRARDLAVLRGPLARNATGFILRYDVPVPAFDYNEARPVVAGALIVELRLDALCERIVQGSVVSASAHSATDAQHLIIILDRAGEIVYHTNRVLNYQPVASAMPTFAPVAQEMATGQSGAEFFQDANARWLAVYQPVAGLDLSVAAAANADAALAGLQRTFAIGLVGTLLTALAAAVAASVIVAHTSQRINRVAEAAAEIAAGNLEQRLLVQSTDETQLLAESFNLMSDRLREQIAHEAENKQFQSFLRLSAMLTHDLKNAITGLAILVSNMERHMHRAEFRADAINSLRAATDKLRSIVARLHEPVRTLSGEYRHALAPTDLCALIARVLETTSADSAPLHTIERHLPAQLVVPVDAERIERVLENLVINALEAMGTTRGRLTIEAGVEDERHVFVSVCDTGLGISAEFIAKRLFHPFATTKERGIGLGLYTCREIVRAHGGRLDVKSEVGVGTCFRLVLPSEPVVRLSQTSAARSQQTTDAK
jgi:signal transduction histidine kinase